MFPGDEADDSARITLPEMSDARHVLSRLDGRRCLEGMTEHNAIGSSREPLTTKVVVIGKGGKVYPRITPEAMRRAKQVRETDPTWTWSDKNPAAP